MNYDFFLSNYLWIQNADMRSIFWPVLRVRPLGLNSVCNIVFDWSVVNWFKYFSTFLFQLVTEVWSRENDEKRNTRLFFFKSKCVLMLDCHFPHSLSSILVSVAEQWDRETEFQVEITEQVLPMR